MYIYYKPFVDTLFEIYDITFFFNRFLSSESFVTFYPRAMN